MPGLLQGIIGAIAGGLRAAWEAGTRAVGRLLGLPTPSLPPEAEEALRVAERERPRVEEEEWREAVRTLEAFERGSILAAELGEVWQDTVFDPAVLPRVPWALRKTAQARLTVRVQDRITGTIDEWGFSVGFSQPKLGRELAQLAREAAMSSPKRPGEWEILDVSLDSIFGRE